MAPNNLMKVLSVNVGMPRPITHQGRTIMTGIDKEPVNGPVKVHTLGLAGDGQADLTVHGGIHKAVYAYPSEHYEFWSRELGSTPFIFGQFGENLTTIGLDEDSAHIGDRFRINTVLLEVTQPRVPCFKLAHKMGRMDFPKHFMTSGRTGFYFRVVTEGSVVAGDAIERIHTDSQRVSVRDMMRIMHLDREDFLTMEKALAIPALAPEWREEFVERLNRQ